MRKVSNSRRRFNKKDIASWSLIFLGHYFSFAFYLLIFLVAFFLKNGGNFWPPRTPENSWVYFILVVAPSVNALLHIIYDEIGSLWIRLSMWVYSFGFMIMIPVLVFVFL